MKKVLFLMTMVGALMMANAQQFNLLYNGANVNNGDTVTYLVLDEEIEVYFGIENTASAAQTFQAQVEILESEEIEFTGLCAGGDCIPQTTSAPFEVAPGATYSEFHVAMALIRNISSHTHAFVKLTIGDANTMQNSKTVYVRIQSESYVGIQSAEEVRMNIYPNPAADRITIQSGLIGESLVVVMDMGGRIVISQPMAQGSTQLDLSGFASGTYAVQVFQNGRPATRPQVVVR